MRLKNKKTGKIVDFNYLQTDYISPLLLTVSTNGRPEMFNYYSLAEINEEWEDVPEEPKGYWYVDDAGVMQIGQVLDSEINMRKSIGNYFNTREEAEKAVEKLKAWKRLKDIGCRFVLDDDFTVKFVGPKVKKIVSAEEAVILCDDYRLLFGGEK